MSVDDLLAKLHLPVMSRMPGFDGATGWLNAGPLTPDALEGKVVAVDFWTFTCINWLRTLPYHRAWNDAYRDHGLVVVGVHTPEFGVEHEIENVRRAVRDLGVDYAVVLDNDYAIWNAFANQYWPALYIADAKGFIRYHHFGEGAYEKSEKVIRTLLTDAGAAGIPPENAPVAVRDLEEPANWHAVRSPETYVGLARSSGFASPGGPSYGPQTYVVPDGLHLNEWALGGTWTVGREEAVCDEAGGRIAYEFHARDLNLILVPPPDGTARIRVTLDGGVPGAAHGLDVDEAGTGIVSEPRLFQLLRQPGPIATRHFEVEFLDPGAAALCFTFG